MQGKINMLNRILLARLENETTGRQMTYPPDVKKELQRKYRRHFGRDVWKGSVFEVYQDFLAAQAERGKAVPPVGTAFDLYDLAALAFIYKRIKEIDGIREASHVIIDEAQDFGMTAYGAPGLLSPRLHLYYHGRCIPEYSFRIWTQRLGRAEGTAPQRTARRIRGTEEELPKHRGDLRLCHRHPAPRELPCLSGRSHPPPRRTCPHCQVQG